MPKDYIPRAGADFHLFQKIMVDYVTANAAAWNIPAAAASAFAAASAAYDSAYKKATDPLTRTKAANAEHAQQRKSFEKQLRTFVNAWLLGNSAISLNDKTGMGLRQRHKKRHRRTAINVMPQVSVKSKSGGRIQLVCRIPETEGKGRLHPEADAIEVFYALEHPPADPLTGTQRHISKKAHITIEIGQQHAGKFIYIYARYLNLQDMRKSGPLSQYVMTMVGL